MKLYGRLLQLLTAVALLGVGPALAADDACKADVVCWGGKHAQKAWFDCKDAIERSAEFQIKWYDMGWLKHSHQFTAMRWPNGVSGDRVVLVGDDLQVQNQFGAWQKRIFECDFDTKTSKVISTRTIPGSLPRSK
jgi:hypothetical protein